MEEGGGRAEQENAAGSGEERSGEGKGVGGWYWEGSSSRGTWKGRRVTKFGECRRTGRGRGKVDRAKGRGPRNSEDRMSAIVSHGGAGGKWQIVEEKGTGGQDAQA
eukprot:33059-Rhodomonas_salina.1